MRIFAEKFKKMTAKDYEEKIREIYFEKRRTINAVAATLLAQTHPDGRLMSRTRLWMLKHDINNLLDDFPDAFRSIDSAEKFPDYSFPPDNNEEIQKYFNVKLI